MVSQPEGLYEGERLLTASDSPGLTYFVRGDSSKPVVVFIPGAYHNGRIAYGGHRGCRPSDFLGHWLQNANYSFLALSYPLESDPVVMATTRPDFTVQDWGAQAVGATKHIIEQEALSSNVILLFWSMAGKILKPFAIEAKARGLNVKLAISLVATPALRGLRDAPAQLAATTAGYLDRSHMAAYFYAQLHEQNDINGGRCIIPDETYDREYLGNTPSALVACGVRWSKEERKLVEDPNAGFEEAEKTALGDLPFLGAIIGDSPLDFRHSVADKATWGLYMTYQLLGVVNAAITASAGASVREKLAWLKKDPGKVEKVKTLLQSYADKMCVVVRGNHLFMLGEYGAKQTAEQILNLEALVAQFQSDLSGASAV